MLERGYTPRYKRLGIAKPGEGGGLEQVGFHGLETGTPGCDGQGAGSIEAFGQSALNGLDDERLSIFNSCVLYPHELPTERLPEQPPTTCYYESRSTAQLRHRPC
jgi:hypothetical protein